jgi:hypothetical protein
MKLLHPSDAGYDIFVEKYGESFVLDSINFLRQCKTLVPYEDISQSIVRGFAHNTVNEIIIALTVFYSISPVEYGQEGTFKVNSTLTTELKALEDALERKRNFKPYLELRDYIFYYNASSLKLDPDKYVYTVLRIIFEHFNGKSGEISYRDLYELISKHPKFKGKKVKEVKMKKDFRSYITSNTDGLGLKIKPVEQNGRRLIEVIYGEGIYFNNGGK